MSGPGPRSLPVAGTLLLAAATLGVVAQGGFHREQAVPLVVVSAAVALAALLGGSRPARRVVLAGAVAVALVGASATLSAAHAGHLAGSLPVLGALAVAVAGLWGAAACPVGLRPLLVDGLLLVGAIVAGSAWVGVAFRVEPWGAVAEGLWRGASVLTYANAAACILALLLAAGLGRIDRDDGLGDVTVRLALVVIAAGLASTQSRAGVLALAVGVLTALVLSDDRAELARLAWPVGAAGAIALVGLLPGTLAEDPGRPLLALAGLAGAVAVAVAGWWAPAPRRARRLAKGLVLGGLAVAVLVVPAVLVGDVGDQLGRTRLQLSPDRANEWRAAADELASEPVLGVGPSELDVRWDAPNRPGTRSTRFAHNEYLELAATQGVVGLLALALAVGLVARALRPRGSPMVAVSGAGVAAFAVHSALDFVWHLPVILLFAGALAGVVAPPPVRRGQPYSADTTTPSSISTLTRSGT